MPRLPPRRAPSMPLRKDFKRTFVDNWIDGRSFVFMFY
jgi:hypothetical protein